MAPIPVICRLIEAWLSADPNGSIPNHSAETLITCFFASAKKLR
jgi:hypothetical protein